METCRLYGESTSCGITQDLGTSLWLFEAAMVPYIKVFYTAIYSGVRGGGLMLVSCWFMENDIIHVSPFNLSVRSIRWWYVPKIIIKEIYYWNIIILTWLPNNWQWIPCIAPVYSNPIIHTDIMFDVCIPMHSTGLLWGSIQNSGLNLSIGTWRTGWKGQTEQVYNGFHFISIMEPVGITILCLTDGLIVTTGITYMSSF